MSKKRAAFEAWYEADAMPCEADWFKRDPDAPDEYDSAHTHVAWKAWQAALQPKQPDPATRPSMSMFASAADYNAAMDKWLTPTPPSVRRTT